MAFLLVCEGLRVSEMLTPLEEESKMDAYLNEYIVNMIDNQEYRDGIVMFPLLNRIKSIFSR